MRRAADLLVVGGRLWPTAADGADALALGDGRILAAGRAADLMPWRGPATRVLDARGATVTPGITDAHVHLVQWARALGELALDAAWDRPRVLEAVRAHQAEHPHATVLVGRGWAADGWSAPPDLEALDAVGDGRPVLLHSKDFHTLWVNRAALARAGVTDATRDPDGGRFERDVHGRLTGVVREHAVRAFHALMPAHGAERDRALLGDAVQRLHASGVTMVHDFEGADEARVLQEALEPRRLRVLMHVAHAALDALIATGLTSGVGDDWFRVGAVKLFADGTLGSRTASMLQPYASGGTGMELLPPAELAALVRRAIEARVSVAIHAIGDRAVRASLDAFEAAPAPLRARLSSMPRIEHAQLVDPADRTRFARLGVAASMQPSHQVADIALARREWPDRLDSAYPWHSLLADSAVLAFGSDAPVEPPSVALGLHAALTRRPVGAPDAAALSPRERVSLDAALHAYTRGAARVAGREPGCGTLSAGAPADVVVWDRDLFAATPDAVADARARVTVVAGEVVWELGGEPAAAPDLHRTARGGQEAIA